MNELGTVYSAELARRLRSRVFWIGLLFGAIGVAFLIRFPLFMESFTEQTKRIVLAGDPSLIRRAEPLLAKDFSLVGTMPPGRTPVPSDLRAHGNAAAIVVLKQDAGGLSIAAYAKDPSTLDMSQMRHDLIPLNVQLATQLSAHRVAALLTIRTNLHAIASKFGSAAQADQARVIAYLLLVFLYVLIVLNSQLIIASVAEEKTSRIAELLVASVNPSALLAGKILASGTLAVLQMVVWVAVGFLFGASAGMGSGLNAPSGGGAQLSLQTVSGTDIAGFVIFFLLGYFEMATLFAAVGSLVNHTEDLGALGGPLFIPIIAAFFIALSALAVPDSAVVVAGSFIPVISPFVMFARIVVSDVPIWQIAVSIVLNIAALWGIAVLGGKVYRVGMLLYGRTPRFWQIWQVLRT